MAKAKKGLADENEDGFILNESGSSVTVDHVEGENDGKPLPEEKEIEDTEEE